MSIFVNIASYKDPETIPTILDCYNKAKFKQDIHFGVLLQEDENYSDLKLLDNKIKINFLRYDWRDSRGACWARHTIQKLLFDNEDYYLQIDSHHRFCEHWDEILIEGITELKHKYQSPIIGGYCPGYKPNSSKLEDRPMKIVSFPEFTDLGDLMFRPQIIKNHRDLQNQNTNFIPARFLSGHFIFAENSFVKECPYDPLLYFRGEELSLSARAYTSGYDFFHPTRCIIWHEYIRASQTKHWNDHTENNGFFISSNIRSNRAKMRVRQLLGMEKQKISFEKYGLGNKRDLHEYELYAGLNFANLLVHKNAYNVNNELPDPYLMSEKEWNEGMLKKYNIEFNIGKEYIEKLLQSNIENFGLFCYDEADKLLYRKDLKRHSLKYINKKTLKIIGAMEKEPKKISILTFEKNNILPKHKIQPTKVYQE